MRMLPLIPQFCLLVSAPLGILYGADSTAVKNVVPLEVEMVPLTGYRQDASLIDHSALIDLGDTSGMQFEPPRKISRPSVIWDKQLPVATPDTDHDAYLSPYVYWSLPELERYTQAMPDDAYGWMVLGVRYYQTNQLEKSLSALSMSRRTDPMYERSAEIYSAILIHAGDLNKAQKELRRMLDELPHNPILRFNAACGYALQSKSDEALYHLRILASLGWQPIRHHLHDPDLDSLRKTSEFQKLEERLDNLAREMVLSKLLTPSS
ncbi:MAG TPA: hypothetical protein PJ991_10560 [Kiritimatiellia bacterium]|nr:hypothetical protein [Kiritimatiellia bacterium]